MGSTRPFAVGILYNTIHGWYGIPSNLLNCVEILWFCTSEADLKKL